VGIIEVSALVAVSNWFIKKRGRALGVVNSGTRMGQALLPLYAQMLILARGWRSGWIGLTLVAWALGILPTALFMKRRPEDLGLLPDGESSNPVASEGKNQAELEPIWTARAAIRTSAFWLITVAFAQTFMATGGINLHQFPHMTDMGISPSFAVGAITTLSICATVGGIFWPTLAERFDVRYCLALALTTSALGVLLLMSVRSVPVAYIYAITYGFTYGGLFPLFGLAQANYFGRTSLATIRGLAQPMLMTSNALGPLLAGWIYDLTRSYQVAFSVFIVAYLLSVLWVLLARPPLISS
jgi:MFS family permease